jgi:hypothetical protein
MVKWHRGGRRRGIGGRGVTPLIASMPERYNPQEDEKSVEKTDCFGRRSKYDDILQEDVRGID